MFKFLRQLIKEANEPQNTGALIDTRSPEEKKNDVHISDIVAKINVVEWKEKKREEWRRFPEFNQNQSYMCGANMGAKMLGIAGWIKYGVFYKFSRAHIYQRRFNKNIGDGEGMMMSDIFKILGLGVTLEQLTNEKINTDYDADTLLIDNLQAEVGKAFAISGAVYVPNDIEVIASVIQTTGKGVGFLTYFTSAEWSREVPIILDYSLRYSDDKSLRHFIVGVDNFRNGIVNGGSKFIKIEDSAWFGGLYERLLTEDWIKNRVIQAGYPMNFKFLVGTGDRPSYDGMTIISVQKCLRFEGLFPMNVDFFENVGPTTRTALIAFQKKYGIVPSGIMDASTKNKLYQLYP